ncbi:hypothetical protein GNI_084210, partial [Gregarina niphandrodes]
MGSKQLSEDCQEVVRASSTVMADAISENYLNLPEGPQPRIKQLSRASERPRASGGPRGTASHALEPKTSVQLNIKPDVNSSVKRNFFDKDVDRKDFARKDVEDELDDDELEETEDELDDADEAVPWDNVCGRREHRPHTTERWVDRWAKGSGGAGSLSGAGLSTVADAWYLRENSGSDTQVVPACPKIVRAQSRPKLSPTPRPRQRRPVKSSLKTSARRELSTTRIKFETSSGGGRDLVHYPMRSLRSSQSVAEPLWPRGRSEDWEQFDADLWTHRPKSEGEWMVQTTLSSHGGISHGGTSHASHGGVNRGSHGGISHGAHGGMSQVGMSQVGMSRGAPFHSQGGSAVYFNPTLSAISPPHSSISSTEETDPSQLPQHDERSSGSQLCESHVSDRSRLCSTCRTHYTANPLPSGEECRDMSRKASRDISEDEMIKFRAENRVHTLSAQTQSARTNGELANGAQSSSPHTASRGGPMSDACQAYNDPDCSSASMKQPSGSSLSDVCSGPPGDAGSSRHGEAGSSPHVCCKCARRIGHSGGSLFDGHQPQESLGSLYIPSGRFVLDGDDTPTTRTGTTPQCGGSTPPCGAILQSNLLNCMEDEGKLDPKGNLLHNKDNDHGNEFGGGMEWQGARRRGARSVGGSVSVGQRSSRSTTSGAMRSKTATDARECSCCGYNLTASSLAPSCASSSAANFTSFVDQGVDEQEAAKPDGGEPARPEERIKLSRIQSVGVQTSAIEDANMPLNRWPQQDPTSVRHLEQDPGKNVVTDQPSTGTIPHADRTGTELVGADLATGDLAGDGLTEAAPTEVAGETTVADLTPTPVARRRWRVSPCARVVELQTRLEERA